MVYKIRLILITFLLFTPLIPEPAFCAMQTVEYLCETGINFYRVGRYDDALMEFKKALMMDSSNQTAKTYINNIFKQEMPLTTVKEEPILQAEIAKEPIEKRVREEIIDKTLEGLSKKEGVIEEPAQNEIAGVKITGHTQLSVGVTAQDTLWKQADGDLNEENWRTLSEDGYNRRANTFDPRIYDRLRVNLDSKNAEGVGFHSNITIDPWSFTGKSDKITITGVSALTDTADVELYYWGNSSYTVSHAVFTKLRGDSFSLGESKVVDDKVSSKRITSLNGNIFTIPETEIEYGFQPLRELWFDYKQEGLDFRFFPIAYQDQAFTSDDPLRLSNNRSWWEESPWLDRWLPGNFNSPLNDFNKGKFDDAISYRSRDSDGAFLTALRGFSFSFTPQESTYFGTTLASPKMLWQDYDSFDNFSSASRIKHSFTDNFIMGTTYTFRLGFNENQGNKKDLTNHVIGADLGYQIIDGLKASGEVAQSFSKKDLTSPNFASKSSGNAYYLSLMGRFPQENIIDAKTYDEIKPGEEESFFTKARLFYAHMDKGFDPALSTYRETRDDAFWSRHINFRKPFAYYYSGLYYPALKWEDVEPFRIGNGIDIGRDVVGFRAEASLWDKKLYNLFDIRNVHNTNGKFIENATRDEVTYKLYDNLTAKLLGIYQKLPKTKGGVDPFIFESDTGIFVNNAAITDAQDPTLKTGSIGLEYAFNDWMALSGVWERTNDYTLAYDNFPRGNLTSTAFTTYSENNRVFRREDPFLYSQALFPLAPYPFYNIFKTGLKIMPIDDLEIYLDYTRNEFKSAGQIDDNINHIGFEAAYLPVKKLGVYFKYIYSRWNDLTLMTQGYSKYYLGHHNLFAELRYLPGADDELVLQYGEAGRSNIATTYTDPFNAGVPTLDTRHILRMFYRRKF